MILTQLPLTTSFSFLTTSGRSSFLNRVSLFGYSGFILPSGNTPVNNSGSIFAGLSTGNMVWTVASGKQVDLSLNFNYPIAGSGDNATGIWFKAQNSVDGVFVVAYYSQF